MNQELPPLPTRVDELLIGYGVTVDLLDPSLHVCDSIFPLCINLGCEVNRRSEGLPGEEIPGRLSAEVS